MINDIMSRIHSIHSKMDTIGKKYSKFIPPQTGVAAFKIPSKNLPEGSFL